MLLTLVLIGAVGFIAAWAFMSFTHDVKSVVRWSVRTFGGRATAVFAVILAAAFAALLIRLFG